MKSQRTIVQVCHASTPLGEPNPTTILIDEEIPQFDSLVAHGEFFQTQAEMIVDALEGSLPQGVCDRVMSVMISRWSKHQHFDFFTSAK